MVLLMELEMLKHFVKYGMKIAHSEDMKVKVLVVHAPLIKLIFIGHTSGGYRGF